MGVLGVVLSVRPVMRVVVSVGALAARSSRRAGVVCWCHVCIRPAILRAVFCTICSLSMFVSDALGDHMVEGIL